MATLYVRNFPDELYEKVKALAAERRRSMAAEVIMLMDRAIQSESPVDRHLQALERIAERRRRNPQPPGAADTLTLLREDRSR